MAAMERERVKRLVFGEVAELYDARRPAWPSQLVADAMSYAGVQAGDAVIEIGAGTGKASVAFAEAGVELTCVEPDPSMASVAIHNLEPFANASVHVSSFEDFTAERKFRLLISAQAWHWIDRETRIGRACDVLDNQGVLALFWHAAQWKDHPLRSTLDQIYARCAPSLESPGWFPEHINRTADVVRGELQESDRIRSVEVREYPHSQTYSSNEYAELLLTQSDHRLLDEPVRNALIEEVRAAIDNAGGHLTLDYAARSVLARPQ